MLSGINLPRESRAAKWTSAVMEGAEAQAQLAKLRFMQAQAVQRGRKIMSIVGYEETVKTLGKIGGTFKKVQLVDVTRTSNAIDFPHSPTYGRIVETQHLGYKLRTPQILLGGLALNKERHPNIIWPGSSMQVREYPGDAEEESSADVGEWVSSVRLTDLKSYHVVPDGPITRQLEYFMDDMQALSVTLGLSPELDD